MAKMTNEAWGKYDFKKSDFKCPCGGKYCNLYPAEVEEGLVNILQKYSEYVGSKPNIRALRCKEQNRLVGGIVSSRHLSGEAADIQGFTTVTEKNRAIAFFKKQPNYRYAYTNQQGMKNAVHIEVYPIKFLVTSSIDRNLLVDQVEVVKTKLHVRSTPTISENNILGYIPLGIYNVLEIILKDDYTWYKIADNNYIANTNSSVFLPKELVIQDDDKTDNNVTLPEDLLIDESVVVKKESLWTRIVNFFKKLFKR